MLGQKEGEDEPKMKFFKFYERWMDGPFLIFE